MFALFPKFGARTRTQDLWPFLISETGLKFLIWTQGKIHPGQPGSYEEALKSGHDLTVFGFLAAVTKCQLSAEL